MSRVWRVVLTWFLGLALPVQGLAAATMAYCAPAAGGMSGSHVYGGTAASRPDAHTHAHAHGAQSHGHSNAHSHDDHAAGHGAPGRHAPHAATAHATQASLDGSAAHAAAAHDDPASLPTDTGAAASDVDTTGCSVCATCCTAATPPAATIEHHLPQGHAVYALVAPSAHPTFLTSGLDRPPRLILA